VVRHCLSCPRRGRAPRVLGSPIARLVTDNAHGLEWSRYQKRLSFKDILDPKHPPTNNGGPINTLAYWLATGLGAGLLPLAPGTFGAVEGVLAFLAIEWFAARGNLGGWPAHIAYASVNVAVFLIGVAASNRVCRLLGLKDPGRVVIDEINGEMISLTPLLVSPTLAGVLAGFVLFRLFDIWKPFPIRRLELLPSGLGVMADDALAGIYAAVLLWAGRHFQVI
ncbi:MAG TPA: phosphatidylglycerophosphatase A, partial [Blastocatellia bacterium]